MRKVTVVEEVVVDALVLATALELFNGLPRRLPLEERPFATHRCVV